MQRSSCREGVRRRQLNSYSAAERIAVVFYGYMTVIRYDYVREVLQDLLLGEIQYSLFAPVRRKMSCLCRSDFLMNLPFLGLYLPPLRTGFAVCW